MRTPDSIIEISRQHLRDMMAKTPHREIMLQAWIDVFDTEEDFYLFFDKHISPLMWESYLAVYTNPTEEGFDTQAFQGLFRTLLANSQHMTYKVIQRKAEDPEDIKALLILFGLFAWRSAKGLSGWLHPRDVHNFDRIVELLNNGVDAQYIPAAIEHDIDPSMMISLVEGAA